MEVGAPSIADAFRVFVTTTEGRTIPAQVLRFPAGSTVRWVAGDAEIDFSTSDFLPTKAALQLIPTNGAVQGFMLVMARGLSQEQASRPGTKFALLIHDSLGTQVEGDFVVSSNDVTAPFRFDKLQPSYGVGAMPQPHDQCLYHR